MEYLWFFAGVIFHLLSKFRDAYTQSQSFDFKRHLVLSLLLVPVGIAILYFLPGEIPEWTGLVIGYNLDSVVKNWESYPWKKIG